MQVHAQSRTVQEVPYAHVGYAAASANEPLLVGGYLIGAALIAAGLLRAREVLFPKFRLSVLLTIGTWLAILAACIAWVVALSILHLYILDRVGPLDDDWSLGLPAMISLTFGVLFGVPRTRDAWRSAGPGRNRRVFRTLALTVVLTLLLMIVLTIASVYLGSAGE